MRKYFWTLSVMALFAIGFTSSDENEGSNNKSSSSVTQTEQVEQTQEEIEEVKEEEKLFQPGNSYISNKISYSGGYNNSTIQYELSIYKDGTFELRESYRHDEGGVDYEYEGKWKKNTESRKDIVRTWYTISSDHAKNDFRHGTKILIDEDGRIYYARGRSEHEAVGGDYEGSFRKK